MGQESLGCGFHVIKMVSAAGWNVGGRLEVGGATGREQHSPGEPWTTVAARKVERTAEYRRYSADRGDRTC